MLVAHDVYTECFGIDAPPTLDAIEKVVVCVCVCVCVCVLVPFFLILTPLLVDC
jgi:hypothetical protein